MTENAKKRKYEDENRKFQREWTEKYAFIDNNGKSLCLICKATISNYKGGNLRRHYEVNHADFPNQYSEKSNLRTEKLKSLQSSLQKQQGLLLSFSKEDDRVAEVSFKVAWNIARAKRPYGEGEFIKKNLEDSIKILDPDNKKLHKLIEQVPLSRRTTERRISEISANIENCLKFDLKNCTAFSLALDESTDIQDIPQLAVYIRYVFADIQIKEELLDLVPLIETTRGVDIKNALDNIITKFELPTNKLVSIATDGAPAMVGKIHGLIGLLNKDPTIPRFLPLHCVVHREHLIAKYFKYENVWKTVLQIVNLIKANAKTHRQFKNFIDNLQEKEDYSDELPSDLSFWCMVRWLSMFNVLSRFVELLNPIKEFTKQIGKTFNDLHNDSWLSDLMFFTDTLEHLQNLNLALQGKGKNIIDLSQTVFSFKAKLQLFINDLKNKTFNHFPKIKANVINIKEEKLEEYEQKLIELQEDFQQRFEDLQNLKSSFTYFLNPFACNIVEDGFSISEVLLAEKASGELELLEMKEDQALQIHHKSVPMLEFWQLVPESKYPSLKIAACRLLSIFGTTYNCESTYSTMKFVKSKYRSQMTNKHLSELIRTATTNIEPNFKKLVKDNR